MQTSPISLGDVCTQASIRKEYMFKIHVHTLHINGKYLFLHERATSIMGVALFIQVLENRSTAVKSLSTSVSHEKTSKIMSIVQNNEGSIRFGNRKKPQETPLTC